MSNLLNLFCKFHPVTSCFFYQEYQFTLQNVTLFLFISFKSVQMTPYGIFRTAYQQLANTRKFEIMLVHGHGSFTTYRTASEESLRRNFNQMPRLAFPFINSESVRICNRFPRTCGLFWAGAKAQSWYFSMPILLHKSFQEAKYIMKLKLDMFWDLNTSFVQENGPMTFSCLVLCWLSSRLLEVLIPLDLLTFVNLLYRLSYCNLGEKEPYLMLMVTDVGMLAEVKSKV